MWFAIIAVVKLGVPIWQGRISPLLDTATRLLVLTCRDRKEVGREEVLLDALEPEALADKVAELRVDLLLCAALSEVLHRALLQRAIRVRPHICGELECVLHAFCDDRLGEEEFRMPGASGAHLRSKRPSRGHSDASGSRRLGRNPAFGKHG